MSDDEGQACRSRQQSKLTNGKPPQSKIHSGCLMMNLVSLVKETAKRTSSTLAPQGGPA